MWCWNELSELLEGTLPLAIWGRLDKPLKLPNCLELARAPAATTGVDMTWLRVKGKAGRAAEACLVGEDGGWKEDGGS